jgi:aspartyl-tRNA(Asn)/glutamyl-tRNA(Gln) amidotransferase subunit A
MGDMPWLGDACSLVDAFRRGERSPLEELEATFGAMAASQLNAFCYEPTDEAQSASASADVSLPFGGVPIGVKELDHVEGWPDTRGSVVFADERSAFTSTLVRRLVEQAGIVLAGQTTSSEFGGVNLTRTVLHGATSNPWDLSRTPGGSSGGSAAAVAGGLLTLATASDGGGSIRIPAGFTGLVGLKATYGRIPRGPQLEIGNYTSTTGCVSRSVRDTARWFDVVNGHDASDPFSLPRVDGWEAGLGTHADDLRGRRVAVVADWGGAVVSPAMWELLEDAAGHLITAAALQRVDGVDTSLPRMGAAWSISGTVSLINELGDRWPTCAEDLTPEMRYAVEHTQGLYGTEARGRIEARRTALNEAMARIFSEVDLVVAASNPDVAFAAEGPLPSSFGGIEEGARNNGRLTFPANLHGCPAISIPAGSLDGLPIGLQVIGPHFSEPLLLELALVMERTRPWPLVAPGAPC